MLEFSPPEILIFILLLIAAVAGFLVIAGRQLKIVRAGRPSG